MRRTVAAALIAATAVFGAGSFTAASAVCGGGQPGEPCYCPEYPLLEKLGISYNC